MTGKSKRRGLPGVPAEVSTEMAMAETQPAKMGATKTHSVITAETMKAVKATQTMKAAVNSTMKAPPGIYCGCRHLD
jgi:hypothetical protein